MPEPRPIARLTAVEQAPRLSVVIPVFNEEANLRTLFARLSGCLAQIDRSYQVVFVDDGSSDGSAAILAELAAADPRVTFVQLARNFGQHSAIFAGFERACGDVVVTLDADLQNPPEEIPKLLAKIDEGYDVVGGWREDRKDSFLRTLPSAIVNKFTARMLGCDLHDYGCMLRAYRRPIVRRMCQYQEISSFIPALATAVGGKIAEVRVAHSERNAGTSKYNLFRLFKLNYDLVTGFSMFPLQLLSIIGFLFSFLGVGFAVFLAIRRLVHGPEAEGMFTLFAILFFFVGTLYVALGLLGEYVGRIYLEVRKRPRFIVAKVVSDGKEVADPDAALADAGRMGVAQP